MAAVGGFAVFTPDAFRFEVDVDDASFCGGVGEVAVQDADAVFAEVEVFQRGQVRYGGEDVEGHAFFADGVGDEVGEAFVAGFWMGGDVLFYDVDQLLLKGYPPIFSDGHIPYLYPTYTLDKS